jgi:chemotaxis response regulator CheB
MEKQPLIGIICDASFSALAGRIKSSGYRIARVSPSMVVPGSLPPVDAWAIDCDDTDLIAEALTWIETPVVALSNRPSPSDRIAYKAWAERIVRTLDKWTANSRQTRCQETQSTPTAWSDVEGVWILAGSAGADEAVVEFLESLPAVPPVAMIYAQHTEGSQIGLVEKFAAANSNIRCSLALGRHWLNPGHLLVTPNCSRLGFSNQGEVFSLRDGWGGGKECPDIDQLIMEMMGLRSGPGGIILFSGDRGDGLQGALALRGMGARIWAQDPDSAVFPGLPRAAQQLRLAKNIGTPAELAADLAALYAHTAAKPPVYEVTYPTS